jgi:hypothetical protein
LKKILGRRGRASQGRLLLWKNVIGAGNDLSVIRLTTNQPHLFNAQPLNLQSEISNQVIAPLMSTGIAFG